MYSESFFAEPPIQIKAGSEGKIFYAHPGIFTPFPKSALYARLNGPWKANNDGILDLTEFDEHTIECCLSYFYRRTYYPHDVTPKPDSKTHNDEVKVEQTASTGIGESLKGNIIFTDAGFKQFNATFSNKDSPLDSVESTVELRPIPVAKRQDTGEKSHETLVAEASTHSRVYTFAHMYLLPELETFALHSLGKVLVALQKHKVNMPLQLADAVRLIYGSTKDCNPAREMVSRFIAINFTFLLGDSLKQLMQEGGDFAVDLTLKLARDCPPGLRPKLQKAIVFQGLQGL